MKSLLTIIIAILISANCFAQKAYTTSKDDETGAVVFKGPVTLADLNAEPTFTWMAKGTAAYVPDSTAIKYLRKELPAYTIVAVMGTWCDDSQYLIPKLNKVLQAARYPTGRFVMYGADRAKETGGIEARLYEIKKVPTIIVYKGQIEVGRIVESVKRSVEVDLVQILEQAKDK